MILNNRLIGVDYDNDMEDLLTPITWGDLNDATHSTDEPLVPSTNNSRIAKTKEVDWNDGRPLLGKKEKGAPYVFQRMSTYSEAETFYKDIVKRCWHL